ncbi:MAG: hypothetical protein ACOX7Q_16675 [Kiritimatiellia bacterium]
MAVVAGAQRVLAVVREAPRRGGLLRQDAGVDVDPVGFRGGRALGREAESQQAAFRHRQVDVGAASPAAGSRSAAMRTRRASAG